MRTHHRRKHNVSGTTQASFLAKLKVYIYIYIYIYKVTLYVFLFENIRKYKLNDQTSKILLYLDFLQILYKLAMKQKVQKLYTTRSNKKYKKRQKVDSEEK